MDATLAAALLVALAVVYAVPAPRILARLPRLRAAPAPALVLWQAVSLAAVVAGLAAAPIAALHPDTTSRWVLLAAALITGLLIARLLLTGHRTGIALRRARREHRELVDLIGLPEPGQDTVRVLSHPTPTAYCVPGRRSRVVLSDGALQSLTAAGLAAVLDHERAHLRYRHDLVLEHFTVMHTAVPRPVRSPSSMREVQLLLELHADHCARERNRPRDLGEALVTLAEGNHPAAGMAASTGGTAATRLDRLKDRGSHRALSVALLLLASATLALPILLVVAAVP